ncbi:MAG: hypothetical protein PHN74_00505 [Candidatus Pacebacteria bacterium]|nr:hypothetical protein [Candidatus Paceibacterota bacterium]
MSKKDEFEEELLRKSEVELLDNVEMELIEFWDEFWKKDHNNRSLKILLVRLKYAMAIIEKRMKEYSLSSKLMSVYSYILQYSQLLIAGIANKILEQKPTRDDLKLIAKYVSREHLDYWMKEAREKISNPDEVPCRALMVIDQPKE